MTVCCSLLLEGCNTQPLETEIYQSLETEIYQRVVSARATVVPEVTNGKTWQDGVILCPYDSAAQTLNSEITKEAAKINTSTNDNQQWLLLYDAVTGVTTHALARTRIDFCYENSNRVFTPHTEWQITKDGQRYILSVPITAAIE